MNVSVSLHSYGRVGKLINFIQFLLVWTFFLSFLSVIILLCFSARVCLSPVEDVFNFSYQPLHNIVSAVLKSSATIYVHKHYVYI